MSSFGPLKQPTVAKFSTETEYRTIATTTTKLLWLGELLKEFGHPISKRHKCFMIILKLPTFVSIMCYILVRNILSLTIILFVT